MNMPTREARVLKNIRTRETRALKEYAGADSGHETRSGSDRYLSITTSAETMKEPPRRPLAISVRNGFTSKVFGLKPPPFA